LEVGPRRAASERVAVRVGGADVRLRLAGVRGRAAFRHALCDAGLRRAAASL